MNVARRGLIVLTLINLFNYIDRYIIAAISESLRHSSLHISDLQYGLLGSGFIIVYMATAPVFGALGDTRSRPRLIALGVTIWSVATALGGLAWNFASLLAARAMVHCGARAAYAALLGNRPYVLTVLGYAAYTFALGGMALYIVKFLERVRGVSEGQASVGFAATVILTGLIGIALGGWLSDKLLKVTQQSYLWVSGVATLIAAPLALVGLTAATPAVYWTAIVLAQLLLFSSTGPINSAIVNVVAPEIRATAVAVSIFTIHILGDVPSPTMIGAISDVTSLTKAVLIIPVALLVSGAVWTYAALREGPPTTLFP